MTEVERDFIEWGFTNDENHLTRIRLFRVHALADGWVPVDDMQSDDYSRLRRDGWAMHVIARTKKPGESRYKYEAKVSMWGPDGLQIKVPELYDWPTFQALLRRCSNCKATDVETFRYSFAGRCCAACLPEMRRRTEQPGWCD